MSPFAALALVPVHVLPKFIGVDDDDVNVRGWKEVIWAFTTRVEPVRGIEERKQAERQILDLALHDLLTRLPNRRLLNERLGQTLAACKRSGRYSALMFMDLDNFKPLNDIHGHYVGDLLLIEVAHRISSCVRGVEIVARFGGDAFVVMLSDPNADKGESAKQTRIVAERCNRQIRIIGFAPLPFACLIFVCRRTDD